MSLHEDFYFWLFETIVIIGFTITGLVFINVYSSVWWQLGGMFILIATLLFLFYLLHRRIDKALQTARVNEYFNRENNNSSKGDSAALQNLKRRLVTVYPLQFVWLWAMLCLSLILLPRVETHIDIIVGSVLIGLVWISALFWWIFDYNNDYTHIKNITRKYFIVD
jgi:amino acid transporter